MSLPVSQANHQLSTLPFDPELTPGARNAVNVCLRIQTGEKVTVVTDEATREIAASLIHELENVGATYRAWVLEELAPRPLGDLPSEIVDDLETSQVSVFAVQAQRNLEFAQIPDGLFERDLAPLDSIALFLQRLGDVLGGDGAEELIVVAGYPGEADRRSPSTGAERTLHLADRLSAPACTTAARGGVRTGAARLHLSACRAT